MTGPEVLALRQHLRLSQQKLANLLGVTQNAIYKWERGDNPVYEPAGRLLAILGSHPQVQVWLQEMPPAERIQKKGK